MQMPIVPNYHDYSRSVIFDVLKLGLSQPWFIYTHTFIDVSINFNSFINDFIYYYIYVCARLFGTYKYW